MVATGTPLEARDRFYYARELYYHHKYSPALHNFSLFLALPNTFIENRVEACRFAAYCCYPLGDDEQALRYLLKGLSFRVPGGELCCDLGKHFMDRQEYEQAIFWYLAALHTPKKEESGAFISAECYGYLPCLQLSVCYDRLGQIANAVKYHKQAGTYNPNGTLYLKNESYFQTLEKG